LALADGLESNLMLRNPGDEGTLSSSCQLKLFLWKMMIVNDLMLLLE